MSVSIQDRHLRAQLLASKPLSAVQREILHAIDLHGGLTQPMANRHGWLTHGGLPIAELLELIDRMIVAPRVLTSQPLTVVWQRREKAQHKATLAQIEMTARGERLKEYAPGGFELRVRPDLAAVERRLGVRK